MWLHQPTMVRYFSLRNLTNEWKIASELYLPFWFCFYAHDNYITLEKAKLLIIIQQQAAEEKQKPVNYFIAWSREKWMKSYCKPYWASGKTCKTSYHCTTILLQAGKFSGEFKDSLCRSIYFTKLHESEQTL